MVWAIPNFFKTRTNVALRTTAQEALYYMRYAHSQSVEEGVRYKMIIDDDTLQLQKAAAGNSGQALVFEAVSGKLGRVFELPEGIKFRSAPKQVVFYPDGLIDRVKFSVAGPSGELFFSTWEVPGNVVLLEEGAE